MSFSNIPAHSTEKSRVVELPMEAFIEALSLRKAKEPAAAMKAWEARRRPSTELRSCERPIWL